jgi:hypothetical protein
MTGGENATMTAGGACAHDRRTRPKRRANCNAALAKVGNEPADRENRLPALQH